MSRVIKAAAERLDVIAYPAVRNQDGSVDGLLAVRERHGVETGELLKTIERSLDPLPGSVWVTIGLAGEPTSALKGTEGLRTRGLLEVQMYPTHDVPLLFFGARKNFAPNFEKRAGRKTEIILVKFNWNAKNRQPGREYIKRTRKRRE